MEDCEAPKFRSLTSNRILPAMSPRSGGGEYIDQHQKPLLVIVIKRLSNENVTSVYDDRLDKLDPEGNLGQPGGRQRR